MQPFTVRTYEQFGRLTPRDAIAAGCYGQHKHELINDHEFHNFSEAKKFQDAAKDGYFRALIRNSDGAEFSGGV